MTRLLAPLNRYASILLFVVSSLSEGQTPKDSPVFTRIFGISRILPADLVEQTKHLPVGKQLLRDTNGDGEADEAWYIDAAKRHTVSPLLVRVVDEDGDMQQLGRGDLDSDCYFWDYNADGYIDVVTDYQDDDHDGDVDQMGIFYNKKWPDEKDDLTVWWAVDIGDDNLLWYDVNGNYDQPSCQWRTHFSGDELFYQFRLTSDDAKWVNVWEDPFAFYDPDGDQCSEVVVRISAVGHDVKNLRYSIDADDDAYGRNTHNYDFSITALPSEQGLSSESWSTETLTIRSIETLPLLPWSKTRDFAQTAPWAKAMLTWDELNSNTDEVVDQDPNERWEGILNHASKFGDFPQVGGPPSSAFNKRVEVSHKPASPLRLYADETDHRLHLLGANYGYLDVDYNFDGVVDAAYTWKDDNGDGILDSRSVDVNADGAIDFTHPLKGVGISDASGIPQYLLDFGEIAPHYRAALQEVLRESQEFISVALGTLGSAPPDVAEVIQFFSGPLGGYHPEREIGANIQNSPAGTRFYTDLVRDRLFVYLVKKNNNQDASWAEVERVFFAGKYKEAADALANMQHTKRPESQDDYPLILDGTTYTKRLRIVLSIENPALPIYVDSPVVLDVDDLRRQTPDFNPENCVVVDGDYWLAWRPIAHQVDDWEFGDVKQISFLANLPAHGEKTYFIYYDSMGEHAITYPMLTRAVLDTPAYVAWESDAGAFRFYTGQFDFFGKHEARLLPRTERLLYPIIDQNYHAEQEWGMDALHVGATSGLGGLTLFSGDKEYLVQSPAGVGNVKFTHRVLGAGPVRAAVEITATNVLPETPEKPVLLRCFIYAKHAESEIHVRLPEGLEHPSIAAGLLRLAEDRPFANDALGLIGTWGRQSDEIGEIGLAVIAEPKSVDGLIDLPDERRLKCTVNYDQREWNREHLRYWIVGAWRRGMQFPAAPTADNWRRTAEELAMRVSAKAKVKITAATSIDESR